MSKKCLVCIIEIKESKKILSAKEKEDVRAGRILSLYLTKKSNHRRSNDASSSDLTSDARRASRLSRGGRSAGRTRATFYRRFGSRDASAGASAGIGR